METASVGGGAEGIGQSGNGVLLISPAGPSLIPGGSKLTWKGP